MRRRYRRLVPVLIVLAVPLVLLRQASGSTGAAAADLLRSTLGARRTAQLESLYLNAVDTWQQVQYRAGLTHVQAPWRVPMTATPVPPTVAPPTPVPILVPPKVARVVHVSRPRPRVRAVRAPRIPSDPVLPRLHLALTPSLPGEGVWTASVAPASSRDRLPMIVKAYLRPDPARPYAIATVLRFDLRYQALHMVAGTAEPGGALGAVGAGTIPLADRRPGMLLAAFNGGFKYANGAYGMMVNRRLVVGPINGAATIAVTDTGLVFMGTWGMDRRLMLANRSLVSWRQNGPLLIDHGRVNALAAQQGAWGLTISGDVHTWRSAIGLAPHHQLVYVAGNALSVDTLVAVLKEAGAQTAMELDINPFWVRADFYGRDPARRLTMATLRPDMAGSGADFLGIYSRDFFYLARIPGLSTP